MKIFVYGSLRRGEYNYKRLVEHFGAKEVKYLGTSKAINMAMYSLGAYPYAIVEHAEQYIVGDVLEVSDQAYNEIKGMEERAGYRTVELAIEGYSSRIRAWIMFDKIPNTKRIESGDWKKHVRELRSI